jgi:16S rRNA (cytidine1402-2'-O)-methyltransferase
MTFRAINVLKSVDLILAEDTRVSGKLLKHFEINTKMQSYHMHNEHKILKSIVDKLKSGIEIALISDAGTPAISDPGFLLTRACVDEGIAIECLPGATAFVPALVNSGLPNDRFVFEGFLPIKKGRQTRLKLLAQETRTIVIYVSPHKLNKTLEEIVMYLGPDRQISVSRELSKIYEETLRGTAQSILEHYNSKQVKGEIVLIISGINQDKN